MSFDNDTYTADMWLAKHLALLEEDARGNPLTMQLQSMNRFFLDKISNEFESVPGGSNILKRVSTGLPF